MSMQSPVEAVQKSQPVSKCWLRQEWPFAKEIQFLWFPCGLIRGALASMGINATVQADTSELPGAVFTIKTIATKA